ncbi:uncharacterized protein Z520_03302 [Fonsecaea multimorphosa CBS 102226]|uniref:ABM domain-containing protein n=1 Tax=Fonsecaea multimorphosa CBS 102226 TaxID=1442371 RepID=A0A0D2KV67_9EURO|nr:uncharacterized protein Z520_03302 [Fonsecaea multimorphosa CBS 102226]KIY00639.1 hypothetical protein Z520_03302 [Fonsecaea multimorphosa CBS 102226]
MNLPPIPEDEFVVYADVYAKEGHADELERLIRILIRMVESEPGTLEYVISRDHDEPNHFFVFERYSGREAFDKHCATQEYQNGSSGRPTTAQDFEAIEAHLRVVL